MIRTRIFFIFVFMLIVILPPFNNNAVALEFGKLRRTADGNRMPLAALAAPAALTNFQPLNQDGFGDDINRYAWSMTVFKDDLYVGTWNTQPKFVPNTHTNGTEAYRYVGGSEWERVVDGGLSDIDNEGLRNMIVWDDPDDAPDKGPAIYGTTMNSRDGLEVWRTFDGDHWEVVVGAGSPYPSGLGSGNLNDSGRAMAVYEVDGTQWLYLGTMHSNGGEIWRTPDGVRWEKIADAASLGLKGIPKAIGCMCVYQDNPLLPPALFVGTWGMAGFNVLKSYDGVTFKTVASKGMDSHLNHGVAKLIPFEGRLWLLTVNYTQGFDIYVSGTGTIETEGDWQRIATHGFTHRSNMYAWEAIVYDNGRGPRLYIGTFNPLRGFYLYSVTTDFKWALEIGEGATYEGGMGNRNNCGLRSLAVFDGKLVLGFAGWFKPVEVWTAW